MTSKTICSKHEQAYLKSEGCPYCEPPATVPGDSILRFAGDSILRFPDWFFVASGEILEGEMVKLTSATSVGPAKDKVMQWPKLFHFSSRLL